METKSSTAVLEQGANNEVKAVNCTMTLQLQNSTLFLNFYCQETKIWVNKVDGMHSLHDIIKMEFE